MAVSTLLVMQLSYDICARTLSSKILFLATALMAYLIYTYYTSDLTARMTSGPPPTSIRLNIVYGCDKNIN